METTSITRKAYDLTKYGSLLLDQHETRNLVQLSLKPRSDRSIDSGSSQLQSSRVEGNFAHDKIAAKVVLRSCKTKCLRWKSFNRPRLNRPNDFFFLVLLTKQPSGKNV